MRHIQTTSLSPLIVFLLLTFAVAPLAAAAETGSTGGGQPFDNDQPSLAVNYLVVTNAVDTYLGEVMPFAGNYAPIGTKFADGSLLSINQYTELFSKIGTTYGGDGTTNFALPDLRGRTIIGIGQGQGLTPRTLGATTGSASITLTEQQMPAHTHSLPGSALSTSPAGGNQSYNQMQPSMALNYVMATEGIYPSPNLASGIASPSATAFTPYLGAITTMPSSQVPIGFVACNGQMLQISDNTALYNLIGTTYGGDGVTTFGVPDLRGRTAVDQVNSNFGIGSLYGSETNTLTALQLPAHDHTLPPSSDTTGTTGSGAPISNDQPSAGLNYIIAIQGVFPGKPLQAGDSATFAGDQPFLGEIEPFAGGFAPRGWLLCEGQTLQISQNQALWALLGTTYGGNGVTNFKLPDLRGRTLVGAASQTPGLTGLPLGTAFGNDFFNLTVDQLPPHVHEYANVPEPSTGILAAFAFFGLGLFTRTIRWPGWRYLPLALLFALGLVTVCSASANAGDNSPAQPPQILDGVERKLVKEPMYKESPRYALLVLGENAETKVWIVEDGRTLYVDKNGNGDLTDDGPPLFVSNYRDLSPAGKKSRWDFDYLLDSIDPPTGARFTSFRLAHWNYGDSQDSHGISLKLNDAIPMYAGWTPFWSAKPADAPLLHFGGALTPRMLRAKEFVIGRKANRLSLAFFNAGQGNGAHTRLSIDALPARATPVVTIDWPVASDKPALRTTNLLSERCCYWEFYDSNFRAPDDAVAGTAKLEVSLPGEVFPIELATNRIEVPVRVLAPGESPNGQDD